MICRVRDGAIVGSVNLSQIFLGGFQNAYLGYYVGASHARRGYMTEALQLMLRHAFVKLKLHRLYLKVCGRWQDHERWAIIAEDWKSKPRWI